MGTVRLPGLVIAVAVMVLAGCTDDATPKGSGEASSVTPTTTTPPLGTTPTTSTATTTGSTTGSTSATPSPEPVVFAATQAMDTVRFLAGEVGPREASSASYRRAADWVEREFTRHGYDVRRQQLRVPAGNSWGVDVPAGKSTNVIATSVDFDSTEPHLVVGAHLDTVPQAPGAEDNASGIAMLLELARVAASNGTRLPVMFVAFGAEEPRGDGDALHHFGSRAMVARMPAAERRAITGMVSMDRVGVGTVVPVCTGGVEPPVLRRALLRTAERVDVAAVPCTNTSSDHWSFELAGVPAARVGGTSYAAYHSAADVPSVVDPRQLNRTGSLVWGWLAPSP